MAIQDDMFKKLMPKYYEEGSFLINPIRRLWLGGRYGQINKAVRSSYRDGAEIVDLGCGMCCWNVGKLPVCGIDMNKDIIELARTKGYLADYKVEDVRATSLRSGSCDIVVATEVLEHIGDYRAVIKEMYRILKPGGIVVVSVPYDVILSLWRPAFWFRVFISGYLFRDPCFRNRMGHVNHFNIRGIRSAFEEDRFMVTKTWVYFGSTIFLIAAKP